MSMKMKKFLLFGDSITEFGFNSRMQPEKGDQFTLGAALNSAYARRLDIVPRGYAGYNSRWAVKILPKVLEAESDIVMSTLFFGANDACAAGHQSVPLEEFEKHCETMVKMMKAKNIKPIIIGPALYDETKWAAIKADEIANGYIRSNESFKKYSDACAKLAKSENVAFVNLNEAFKREGGENWSDLLSDGVHLTGIGYEVFYNELIKVIEEKYPEFAPENVPYKLPLWSEIKPDGSNLDQYL